MNDSPSRILDLPLEESGGQADQHNGKSRQGKNIRIDAREAGIFLEQRLERVDSFPKSATQRTQRIKENHREIRFRFPPWTLLLLPGGPQCSLWPFSVSSVLTSEKPVDVEKVVYGKLLSFSAACIVSAGGTHERQINDLSLGM
jgi:hypothetical protein